MNDVKDFIRWALSHIKRESLPSGAAVLIPREECGTEPWEYLFGSIRVETTQSTLDRYYNNHYCKQMTREVYDRITANWSRTGYATDCQGLLDAYLTYELGEPTDLNCEGNYRYYCTEKGAISEISRPYVIGEAVFRANESGRMEHIGWVCGFDGSEPLIVEARSIRYGVVVSKLTKRNFTHRALMSKLFDYKEDAPMPIILKVENPMIQGDAIKALQTALNGLGYTDLDGNKLTEDGRCGKRTMQAVDAFVLNQQSELPIDPAPPVFRLKSDDGDYELDISIKAL